MAVVGNCPENGCWPTYFVLCLKLDFEVEGNYSKGCLPVALALLPPPSSPSSSPRGPLPSEPPPMTGSVARDSGIKGILDLLSCECVCLRILGEEKNKKMGTCQLHYELCQNRVLPSCIFVYIMCWMIHYTCS